jgi:hypothetical protein
VLTKSDLDAIEARLTGRDPAAEVALLRDQLAECWALLDVVARQDVVDTLARAARALLRAHGRPPWAKEEPRA